MERKWTSPTSLILIAAILVVVNLIGINWFVRADLTDSNMYSLSDISIDLVRQAEDPITVTAYFAQDLPSPYNSLRRYLRDKLREYRAYAGDQFQYEFVDPTDNQEAQQQARQYGIPSVQVRVVENNSMQVRNVHMGLTIQYRGEREVIPVVQDRSRLEYLVTSAINSLVSENLPTVGFLTGHGELGSGPSGLQARLRGGGQSQALQLYRQQLSRNYNVQDVSVQDSSLSPEPDVLMVVAPSDSFPEPHLRAIDQHLMDGGKLGLFINRVGVNMRRGQGRPINTGLETLISNYGVNIQQNLVMDQESSRIRTGGGGLFQQSQSMEYPFLPVVQNYNQNHIISRRLNRTLFYFVSSIDSSGVPSGVEMIPLAMSSSNSGLMEGRFMVHPKIAKAKSQNLSEGPFTLAAAYRGAFPSAYQSGLRSPESRIVAVGDGDLVNQSALGQQVSQNMGLATNIVDWLAENEALLTLRSKTIESRQLMDVSAAAKSWIKYMNIILPALLVVIFGLVRWRWRKNRQVVLHA